MALTPKTAAQVALEKKTNNLVCQRVEDAAARAKRRACFWTWPFGHIWEGKAGSYHRTCACCGTPSTRGIYDSAWKYDLAR